MPSSAMSCVAEAVVEVAHLEAADDVPLLLDDALGEVAAEELAGIDADGVAILQLASVPRTGVSPTMIGRSASITSSLPTSRS